MFKIDDCFKSCGIFNEILIKRFEDNFSVNRGSRLWMAPGHVIFTTEHVRVHTCDAKPYDLTSSPSEPDSDELLIATSPVLDIFFDAETPSTRMFVVLTNGDVQIFEYRILLFEWARIGYFNVNIVSPVSNNNHHLSLSHVLVSRFHNMIYWSEQSGTSDMGFNLYRREVPFNNVREITQSSIGVTQKILKNCPRFDLVEIGDNMCIFPHLPNSVHFYLILSPRSHVWVFSINGKCLWRGAVDDNPINFISLCTKTVGLWTQGGTVAVCTCLDCNHHKAYILHNNTLLSINFTGEICSKKDINFGFDVDGIKQCFIMHDLCFCFTKALTQLYIHNTDDGHLLQMFDLNKEKTAIGLWHISSRVPSIGFYNDGSIYKINYKSLTSFLNSDPSCFTATMKMLRQEHYQVYALLKESVSNKFTGSGIPAMKSVPNALQSEALLLATLVAYRESNSMNNGFPFENLQSVMASENNGLTKLRENLRPLVDCFMKIEKCRGLQCDL